MEEMNLEEAIFEEALRKSSASERDAYLEGACRNDPKLRERVGLMLEGYFQSPGFLETVPQIFSGLHTRLQAESLVSLQPGQKIGRYKLLQEIGEGGCGIVYMAEQEEPVRRRVALKIIKLGMDTKQVVARFEAERQALALMDHPNIAKVLDAGATETGRPYFVMELVRGVRITEYCDQASLPTERRLELFMQVGRAIQHAHQKGIIHRDIKPSNILVTLHDGVPVPKVIDFGIAKATSDQRLTDKTLFTAFEQFMGTPAYMSPEQAEMSGLDIDTRSDIYSLGVLLYELLTGKTPFDPKDLIAAGLDEMRRTIREREPARPSTCLRAMLAPDLTSVAKHRQIDSRKLTALVRGDLDWIVMKCLEKDRSRRYDTANGLVMELQRYLKNEAVIARPPSAAYRFQKAFRRNKLAFTAGAAVTASLIMGLGISIWQTVAANLARRAAEEAHHTVQEESGKARAAEAQVVKERRVTERNLYVAKMNLARAAWDENNIGRVRQLLEETASEPDRGFEWYFWQRQAHLELKTLRGHLAGVSSVAFSPDCQRIVTASLDQTAKVWDAALGTEILTLRGHEGGVRHAVFSPDGRTILTASADRTARVWEAATGRELFVLNGHHDGLRAAAFSPDGHRIVTAGDDSVAKVWDVDNRKVLVSIEGHTNRIRTVAFSPDGSHVLTGGDDQKAVIWEARTGAMVRELPLPSWIGAAAYSPDGRRIATGSGGRIFTIWDATNGGVLVNQPVHHTYISPWHTSTPLAAAFSPDSRRIATGSLDHLANVWDAASGTNLFTLKGHEAEVLSVAFSPDGQLIATGSADGTIKVWAASGVRQPLILSGYGKGDGGPGVDFSPDGRRIVTGSFGDKIVKVWDAHTGEMLRTLIGHDAGIGAAAFSPDGRRIVTGSIDQTAKVWDAATGHALVTLKGHHSELKGVAFSPDGRFIVTASADWTIMIWDAPTGGLLRTFKGHTDATMAVAVSPDGRRIVSGSHDNTIRVWDIASGRELLKITGSAGFRSVAFSPDGKKIAAGTWDRRADVWDAATGEKVFSLTGHRAQVPMVAFSPDGRRILTGSFDNTTKVWDADTGQELLTLPDSIGKTFSPDGQRILTVINFGQATVWEIASAAEVAKWQREEHESLARMAEAERHERELQAERHRTRPVRDPGINQWLVLCPIALAGRDCVASLDQEQVPHESGLRPRQGERVKLGDLELVWIAVRQQDSWIDLNRLLQQASDYSVAYAVCYLDCETTEKGLVMKVAGTDRGKIFLNQRELYRQPEPRRSEPDGDQVRGITLNSGINTLVFKIVNQEADWGGSVQFTDAAGKPAKGIRVTLDPAGRD